jgi:hypothetical protein
MPASAVLLTRGPSTAHGDPYPYTQTITGPSGSFDVIMDGTPTYNSAIHLYVSTLFDTISIMKTAATTDNGDQRQINADEVLKMTITNLNGVSVSFTRLNGINGVTYFATGRTLYLYKNNVLVNTIACNGSDSYDIIPPIVAVAGDTIAFNPNGNVRLTSFEVSIAAGFPANDEPYIPNTADTTNLLNTVITTNGHYFVTGDWSGLAHKPNGVVVKVGNGDAVTRLYYLGATGPATSAVDFDLLLLEPGDTVRVVARLTGDAGEDPGLWSVSLDRSDSWSGSRYSVPVVPLGLASPLSGMDMYRDRWPKSSGFRNDYRAFRGQNTVFAFLDETLGHAPKCYGEEITHGPPNIPIMQNYAQNNPDRQALFHWNGKMVRPFVGGTLPAKMNEFKPYHFRYNVGTYLSSAITAPVTQITVNDPSIFTTDTNNYNISIIIPVDPVTGDRLFDGAELVTVTAITGNQLTVIRNVYQSFLSYTSAGNFAAGSYIAPASQSFVDVESGGIRYNHSLLCPVDGQGRNGADMLAEMLSHEFAPGSNLDRLNGIMFDVLPRSVGASEDCNLDGIADGGIDARGVDLYHLGVQGFGRKLRAALPGRILTFDGQDDHWPALHTVFNGVEAEGFSRYNDSYTKRWSKALNYFLFAERWNLSSNFYNFCVTKQNDNPPAAEVRPLRRFHEAGLTAMGVAVSHSPIVMSLDGPFYALDEMRKGVENKLQWLGAPVSELIRPGLSAPDELGGTGLPAGGWSSPDGSATVGTGAEGVLVTPVDTGFDHEMVIEIPGISIPAGDLLIRFEGKGGVPHLPLDTARYINVEVDGRQPNSWTYDRLTGVVNNEGFTEVTAYYRGAGAPGGSTVKLRLIIESAADLTLRNFTIHNASDVLLREFENGIVLCNPSDKTNTFNLAWYYPGKHFKRIQGQSLDDPVVNDGSAVGSSVQLGGYRGLFLEKEGAADFSFAISPTGSGELKISWLTQSGKTYQLQGRTNLVIGGWGNIGSPMVGSGTNMSTIVIPVGTSGFYRITAK